MKKKNKIQEISNIANVEEQNIEKELSSSENANNEIVKENEVVGVEKEKQDDKIEIKENKKTKKQKQNVESDKSQKPKERILSIPELKLQIDLYLQYSHGVFPCFIL